MRVAISGSTVKLLATLDQLANDIERVTLQFCIHPFGYDRYSARSPLDRNGTP
jgi:hypothetical protein